MLWREAMPIALLAATLFAAPLAPELSLETAPILEYRPAVDAPLTATAVALGTAMVVFRPAWGPRACRWCERDADGLPRLNGLDTAARDALRWRGEGREQAKVAGEVLGYGVVPAVGIGVHALSWALGASFQDAATDFLVVGEAVAIAHALEQGFKYSVARARPSVLFEPGQRPGDVAQPDDNFMSMVSGHATVGFALAVGNGTVASLRGYRWAPAVWGVGLGLALGSSWLRIAADRHYLTDVLAGAALGTVVGLAVPLLHRPKATSVLQGLSIAPRVSRDGGGVSVSADF